MQKKIFFLFAQRNVSKTLDEKEKKIEISSVKLMNKMTTVNQSAMSNTTEQIFVS